MGWSLTIGRIAGTAIRLHFTFLLFLVWIGVSDYLAGGPQAAASSISFIVLLFACVTAHEFGHILTARRFGARTPEVILSPIGGIANMERIPEVPAQELLVAIAGPLVNVAIAAILMAVFAITPQELANVDFGMATLAERLILVNVTLVLFNLIPAFPMDGGRVLRALLAMRMGTPKATELAARIGQGFAFLFVLLGLFYNPILLLVGVFIYFAAASEEQAASFARLASDLRVGDAMEPSPVLLKATSTLTQAIELLLSSPQRDFPVVDESGQLIGILDREAMLAGLHRMGGEAEAYKVMRESKALPQGMTLNEAFTLMRGKGAKAEAVSDAGGRVIGVLTLDNISEMMMVDSARPGWRFTKRV